MSVEMKILADHAAWLENRKHFLGGSDISAVIGVNPRKSNVTLWREKTGRKQPEDISDKPYVQYGTKAETYLRGLFRLDFPQYQVEYIENNSWHNIKYPWAAASLDGWLTDQNGRTGILEIKTSEIVSSVQWQQWDNRVPDNYYCQCLFYMAILEADFCELVAQLKYNFDGKMFKKTEHYHIERTDVQEDIDYLMAKGEKFWEHVTNDKEPPLILPPLN